MARRLIKKLQLSALFREWNETNIDDLEIEPANVLNVVIEEGKVYLIYWSIEDNEEA